MNKNAPPPLSSNAPLSMNKSAQLSTGSSAQLFRTDNAQPAMKMSAAQAMRTSAQLLTSSSAPLSMSSSAPLSMSDNVELSTSRSAHLQHSRNVPPLMRISAPQQLSRNALQCRRQEMSSSVPLSMSSNVAPSPGRSAAKCLNRIVKLSGSTSALGVAVATGVIEEVDEAVDGKGAQPLVLSTI